MSKPSKSRLKELQNWYEAQCDEDWEHQYGVAVDTLDNPGWSVRIDLVGTELENKSFEEVAYGVGKDGHPESDDWLLCQVIDRKFSGVGGPQKLEEILEVFLE